MISSGELSLAELLRGAVVYGAVICALVWLAMEGLFQ